MLLIKNNFGMICDGIIYSSIEELQKDIIHRIQAKSLSKQEAVARNCSESDSDSLIIKIKSLSKLNTVDFSLYECMAKYNIGSGERYKIHKDIVGFIPNVANYVAGVPLNMFNLRKKQVKANFIDLAINISYSGAFRRYEIENSCLCLIAIINILKKNNYIFDVAAVRIEMNSNLSMRSRLSNNQKEQNIRYIFGCNLYRNKEGYNFRKIATTMSSEILLRKAKFAWVYTADKYDSLGQGGNFGNGIIHREMSNQISNIINRKCICINQAEIISRCRNKTIDEIYFLALDYVDTIISFANSFEYNKIKELRGVMI